ncbi:hypothetical protein [Gluconobacter kondonii]|uniref:hypothetical protein n=1 Tax=Gluconobacter kondonii TaxID=941463 RepID=UPI001B8BA016|nr:hypothetical protein [Gluconobacter kondonii]MBS1055104.1 hypothetical protein [Gluconobacter kondonii]
MTEKTSVFGSALKSTEKKVLDLKKVDEVAEGQGFVSREAHKRRNYIGPSQQLNVKLPQEIYDRFVAFCDKEEIQFRKGIERLLDETGR